MQSVSEWSFYPSAGQARPYHVGKRCFPAAQQRPLESTLEDHLGRKKPVRVSSEPVPGSRLTLTPEYSSDFHKKNSTSKILPSHKPYVGKRSVDNREVEVMEVMEVMEVKRLDHWKPGPEMMKRILQDCDLLT